MAIKEVLVPDIGNFDSVDVIDVLVKPGDSVAKDDSLITLESDKASMDIPAPFGGTVKEIKIKVGDKATQGTLRRHQRQCLHPDSPHRHLQRKMHWLLKSMRPLRHLCRCRLALHLNRQKRFSLKIRRIL
jgi:hypothetical protein